MTIHNHSGMAQFCGSDAYQFAFRKAEEALGAEPITEETIARVEWLSGEIAAATEDSSESLQDVRKICRTAVLDAVRVHLAGDIDTLIAQLDDLRRDTVNSPGLDSAICSALSARVSLEQAPFVDTLRHLNSAEARLRSVTGAPHAGRTFHGPPSPYQDAALAAP